MNRRQTLLSATALLAGTGFASLRAAGQSVDPAEARAIAKEATIYGFPLVDSYRIQYSYFVDKSDREYKGQWNELHHTARVYTPDDKAIQSPNSDTPYSFLGADLRAEPLIFTVPTVEQGRYYSLQFIDMCTFNFAYVGSRATGNEAGNYLLAGPGWKGATPAGVKGVIRSETEFAFVLYRTQLFNSGDIENVKKVQAGYRVQPLSRFLGQPVPNAPPVEFIRPLTPQDQHTSPEFFNVLSFVLQFCPTDPSEVELKARFARLGLGSSAFDARSLSPEVRAALQAGMADAWKEFGEFKEKEVDTHKVVSGDMVGTRMHLKNNYMYRMAAAVLGIYGNSKEEALYPVYFVDASGQKMDGSHRYMLRFPPGQLPPVNAFWSLTMYQLPESLLYANPLNRYLVNSTMLPELKRDADGGITLYVQHESPGKDREFELASHTGRPIFCGDARVLAQTRSTERSMARAAAAAGRLSQRNRQ